jgi:hypothetical protein
MRSREDLLALLEFWRIRVTHALVGFSDEEDLWELVAEIEAVLAEERHP